MKKILLFVTLVLSISLVSCQKESANGGDGFVDVTLTSDALKTKTEVTAGGTTSWSIGDKVTILDFNSESAYQTSPRTFTNSAGSVKTQTTFSGRLLAGKGVQKYYAFHSAEKAECILSNITDITVAREDLEILSDDARNAAQQGKYCPMVAVPLTFDAENSASPKNFQFHHITSLIEARISPNGKGIIQKVNFDKVVFTITAIDAVPFNKKVTIKMNEIVGSPNVAIPFVEGTEKVQVLTSTITYSTVVNFMDRLTTGTSNFDIPIFALPTKTRGFYVQAEITFYNNDKKQYQVSKVSKNPIEGLNLSGLNIIDFDDNDIVPIK